MEIKVSVIIPVYNADKYVVYTVESALRQTLSGIEIILVDDKSTDGSLQLLRERFGENERVRIVALPENGGVSAARNRGICEASGEYLAFLDSDDAMCPDMLERMYAAAKAHDADVLHTTGCLLPAVFPVPDDMTALAPTEYKRLIPELAEPGDTVYCAPADKHERIVQWCAHRYHWSVWNKLYRRSFVEKHAIRFDNLTMAEDMVFCFRAFFLAERFAVLPGQWYIYRISGDSLSRKKSSAETVAKLTEKEILAADAIARFTSGTAYFIDHPIDRINVNRFVCDSIDRYYLAPAIDELTKETVQTSGVVASLLEARFGENAAFVEYLFWRMHDLIRDGINIAELSTNAEKFSEKAEEERKKHQGEINA